MSSVFMKDMNRNMEEDAALTEQRPRQPMQEDRTPDDVTPDDVMMDVTQEQFEPQTGEMDFIFDGMIEALRRKVMT